MVARLDFKARASGAVDARGIKAKQDELVCILIHSFGLLGVNEQAIKANQEGGLAGLSSRMVARLLRFQGACIGSCGRTGDQSKTGRACMYFDSQFWPAWVCTHRRSKPTRRGDLKDCLCAWSLVCFDFKARASAARVCSAGSADYISGRLFALLH